MSKIHELIEKIIDLSVDSGNSYTDMITACEIAKLVAFQYAATNFQNELKEKKEGDSD